MKKDEGLFFAIIIISGVVLGFFTSSYLNHDSSGGQLILIKGDSYTTSSIDQYTYGGISADGSPIINFQDRFAKGSVAIYIQEGDTIYVGKLYIIEKITSDKVILRRVH